MPPKRGRLPAVPTLAVILPKGAEGGLEFARVVNLLLFYEARRAGRTATIFDDRAGDYAGLDSITTAPARRDGGTGYQYKFFSSPFTDDQRQEIEEALRGAASQRPRSKLRKWILVTPDNLVESGRKTGGGDVTWFRGLRGKVGVSFEIEHWGHTQLISLFVETPALCLHYYPDLVADGASRLKSISDTRQRYDNGLMTLYRNVEFVGMSVYKPEATRGVPMEEIYIPLSLSPGSINDSGIDPPRINPLSRLQPGQYSVILGDPGSGKSTLLKFLALVGRSEPLQKRAGAQPNGRLPIYVALRKYADELKTQQNLPLIRFIRDSAQAELNLEGADSTFFDYYLETGQALLLFDGLDELPNAQYKFMIRDRIRTLLSSFPGNVAIVTSRIVGYEPPHRFDDRAYSHFVVSRLSIAEITQFVDDWYRVRVDNEGERREHIKGLMRILEDPNYQSIRDLAENPLLLTIVALVHRIDAVLPDERVVLYQKCTETLLNTWHTWKQRDPDLRDRSRIERRNRHRVEAIAHWLHAQSGGTGRNQRAVVSYKDLLTFLTSHIREAERPYAEQADPEDEAERFLEFIRAKAGLLVEVGDGQYSFLHLTFQEFLTSSYFITRAERDGVVRLWSSIHAHCDDPRWHEVVRLFVAGLKSDESQLVVIQGLLGRGRSARSIARTRLLGGLLLDGIAAARTRRADILAELTKAGVTVVEYDDVAAIASLLRTLIAKDTVGPEAVREAFAMVATKASSRKRLALELLARAVGLERSNPPLDGTSG